MMRKELKSFTGGKYTALSACTNHWPFSWKEGIEGLDGKDCWFYNSGTVTPYFSDRRTDNENSAQDHEFLLVFLFYFCFVWVVFVLDH